MKQLKQMPKPKRRFRLIYQQATDCWYFIEMPFGLYWGCVKANMKPEMISKAGNATRL